MLKHTLPLLCCLIFSFFGSSALAQTDASQNGQAPTIEFRTLGLATGVVSGLYFRANEKFEEIPITYFRTSRPMDARLAESGGLPIFRKETTPEGEINYVVDRQLTVPAGSRRLLLLAANGGSGTALIAIADNLSSSNKDWLYVNTSKTPVAIQLGEDNKPIGLAPGKSVSHRIEAESGKGAAIRVAAWKEAGWERIYSKFWPVYERQRCIVIFIEENGKMRVHKFFDAVAQNASGG